MESDSFSCLKKPYSWHREYGSVETIFISLFSTLSLSSSWYSSLYPYRLHVTHWMWIGRLAVSYSSDSFVCLPWLVRDRSLLSCASFGLREVACRGSRSTFFGDRGGLVSHQDLLYTFHSLVYYMILSLYYDTCLRDREYNGSYRVYSARLPLYCSVYHDHHLRVWSCGD